MIQPDPLPLLAALVPGTRSIGLGAAVPVSRTEPFHTARAFSVLDHLSGGRTAWVVTPFADDEGAGLPDPAFPALSPAQRYERAAEYIEVAIKLWDSWDDGAVLADKASGIFADSARVHPIDHSGFYFSVRGPLTAIRPLQGRPVIIQSDATEGGLVLAARSADLFLASCRDLTEGRRLKARLHAVAAEQGRTPPALLLKLSPILARTEREARAEAAALDALLDAPLALALVEDRWSLRPGRLPLDTLNERFDRLFGVPPPEGDPSATLCEVARGVVDSRALRFVGTPGGLADLMVECEAAGVCDGFDIVPATLPNLLSPVLDTLLPELARRGLMRPGAPGMTLRERLGLERPIGCFAA
jgi:alkanesulfonate monooxygenase SsuD/methylene tetrahydromethanopterin reductase-like flavin-dependent oxidoreductase (luciferase family)